MKVDNKELARRMAAYKSKSAIATLLEDYFTYLSQEQLEQWMEEYNDEAIEELDAYPLRNKDED